MPSISNIWMCMKITWLDYHSLKKVKGCVQQLLDRSQLSVWKSITLHVGNISKEYSLLLLLICYYIVTPFQQSLCLCVSLWANTAHQHHTKTLNPQNNTLFFFESPHLNNDLNQPKSSKSNSSRGIGWLVKMTVVPQPHHGENRQRLHRTWSLIKSGCLLVWKLSLVFQTAKGVWMTSAPDTGKAEMSEASWMDMRFWVCGEQTEICWLLLLQDAAQRGEGVVGRGLLQYNYLMLQPDANVSLILKTITFK